MAYESKPMKAGAHRIILEEHPEGVYIFLFEKEESKFPEKDYLQDDLNIAMEICERDYGVPKDAWVAIPDTELR